MLELVGLSDLSGKKVSKLSGGQKRRVGLAQSLIGDPRLLVLDEPTTGLDPAQRADLRRTLSVAAGRCAVLLSTHQTEDVAALCERVVVLAAGQVRFDGAVSDLIATAEGQVWLADDPGPRRTRQLAHRYRPAPRGRRPATAGRRPGRAHPRGRLPPDARSRRPLGARCTGLSPRTLFPPPLSARSHTLWSTDD